MAKIVKFTGEPKSADIRRQSQKAITGLFALSPANFSRILSTLPKADQDNANKILSTYMSELPSSGDESDRDTPSTPRAKKTTPAKVSVIISCMYYLHCCDDRHETSSLLVYVPRPPPLRDPIQQRLCLPVAPEGWEALELSLLHPPTCTMTPLRACPHWDLTVVSPPPEEAGPHLVEAELPPASSLLLVGAYADPPPPHLAPPLPRL